MDYATYLPPFRGTISTTIDTEVEGPQSDEVPCDADVWNGPLGRFHNKYR